jgi:hypothetical protein
MGFLSMKGGCRHDRADRRNACGRIGGLWHGSAAIGGGDAQDIANENDLQ